MKNVVDLLMQRGFIDQMTHQEVRDLAEKPMKVYVGFDPTADSLHLGNLVGIMALAWFQKYGHTPIAVLGGATGLIGDPSGKNAERNLLDMDALQHNVRSLEDFFKKILVFKEGEKPIILNNNDWLGKFTWIDFLRDVGKHFRIGPMLAKEMVRNRLQSEDGLSFTEFSYQILQAYDFCYLSREYGVSVQMGGSDQWGNIVSGIELNRKLGGNPLYGITFPLLTKSDGKKFGKSEEGAIWLSSDKLSPYQFYQHLVRVADADVIKLLRVLTFLSLEEIAEIEKGMHVPNSAQKRLAEEVTRFVHGEEGLQAALKATEGMAPGSQAQLSSDILKEMVGSVPTSDLAKEEIVGKKYVDLAVQIGLTASKSECVKLMKNGGAYLNNERILEPTMTIEKEHLIDHSYLLFSAGKKKRLLVRVKK
jgi:tyrosyl-tRNA synthetase